MKDNRKGSLEDMKAFMWSRGENMEAYFIASIHEDTDKKNLCMMVSLPTRLCRELTQRKTNIRNELRQSEFGLTAFESLLSDGRCVRVAYFGLRFRFDFGTISWTSAYNICNSNSALSVFELLPETPEIRVYSFAPKNFDSMIENSIQSVKVSQKKRLDLLKLFPKESSWNWTQSEFLMAAKVQLRDQGAVSGIRSRLFEDSGHSFQDSFQEPEIRS